MPEETKRFYSKKEFADIIGVSLPSVDRRIAEGALKVVHFGKRCLVPASAVDDLLNSASTQRRGELNE